MPPRIGNIVERLAWRNRSLFSARLVVQFTRVRRNTDMVKL